MSIFGIGIDIIETIRIKNFSILKQKTLAKRILSKNELKKYHKKKNKGLFLSKQFAIKEAAAKALGYGIQEGIYFKNFEIHHNNLGKPELKLTGKPLIIFNKLNLKSISVSLTDEKKYVFTIVIIEK